MRVLIGAGYRRPWRVRLAWGATALPPQPTPPVLSSALLVRLSRTFDVCP